MNINQAQATAMVLVAGVLWGIIALFTKPLHAAGLSAIEIAAVRMFVSSATMLLLLLATNRSKLRIQPRHLWMFIGTGIVSVIMFNVCYFTCIQLSEVSIAVVLLYTSPLWVALMSALFFRERMTPRKIAALAMAMTGCVLIAGMTSGASLTPAALGIGLAAGFFFALYSIFSRVALRHYSSETVTFYTFFVAALALTFVGNPGHIVSVVLASPSVALWGVGISLVCTVFPYILYTKGLGYMDTSRAANLATAEPLVGSALGIFAFGETVSAAKLCGMALVLGAVVVLNLPQRCKRGQKPQS